MPFCDVCGRRLDPGAVFCDRCGRKVQFVETVPPGEHMPRPSHEDMLKAPGESLAAREESPEPQVESKPAEPQPLPQAGKEQPQPAPRRRFHVRRRALALAVAGVAIVVIAALAAFAGPVMIPPLPGMPTQTLSQTETTQATGPILQVMVDITKNPVNPGTTEVLIITVQDPSGNPVPNASVSVQVVYPLGQKVGSEGLTGENGQYIYAFYITASADSVGTFAVTVSATKDGYQPGQTRTEFQAVSA